MDGPFGRRYRALLSVISSRWRDSARHRETDDRVGRVRAKMLENETAGAIVSGKISAIRCCQIEFHREERARIRREFKKKANIGYRGWGKTDGTASKTKEQLWSFVSNDNDVQGTVR